MTAEIGSHDATALANVATVDMMLEVVVIPVAAVDRAKQFFGSLAEGVTPAQRADGGTPSRHAGQEMRDCPPLTRSASDTQRPRSPAGEIEADGNEEESSGRNNPGTNGRSSMSGPWEMP